MLSVVNIWRLFSCGVLCGLFSNCADLDRSNPLDPKNPNSTTKKVVLIEAFVSHGTGLPYNDNALQALDDLLRTYGSNVILLEYHVQAVGGNDPLATESNLLRYQSTLYEPDNNVRGTPHVFFDCVVVRIQGAASKNTAYSRYENALTSALAVSGNFTIEATTKLSGTILSVESKVACHGSFEASDVTLCMAIAEDLGVNGLHRVVREFLPIETLGNLEGGEIRSAKRQVQLSSDLADGDFQVIVFVQNTRNGDIYQAALAE